jgi:hypothetical protein
VQRYFELTDSTTCLAVFKKKSFGWVQWLTAIIINTWEAEVWRHTVEDLPGQKVCKTLFSSHSRVWWYMPLNPAMQEV